MLSTITELTNSTRSKYRVSRNKRALRRYLFNRYEEIPDKVRLNGDYLIDNLSKNDDIYCFIKGSWRSIGSLMRQISSLPHSFIKK